ncbi:MAG: 4-hydroxythreonine-4-phosphate dehydrogenase PdxA, partial [Acidobacteriota bacterium]
MPLKPRIGLLAGDPTGIGPEIAAKLLAMPETLRQAEVVLIGDRRSVGDGAAEGLKLVELPLDSPPTLGKLSREAGAYTLASLRRAVETIRRGEIDALVFAPLNKQAMKLAGLEQEDEMHYFAHLLRFTGLCSEINIAVTDTVNLWTTRVTSHVPLRAVADLITEQAVFDAILLLDRTMRAARPAPPRLAVAGLNPHAGEGGLLGTEEIEIIQPAVE